MTQPAPVGITASAQTAHRILRSIQARYQAAGVALPVTQTCSPGTPSEDLSDGMLAIWARTPIIGPSGQTGQQILAGTPQPRSQQYTIILVRCVDNGNGIVPPDPANSDADGTTIMDDQTFLADALVVIPLPGTTYTLEMAPLDPLGNLAGTQVTFTCVPMLDSQAVSFQAVNDVLGNRS